MKIQVRTILLGLLSIGFVQSYAQTFALQVKNDQITYLNDDRGNRILDFSTCGYKSSEQDIPSVRNVVFVPWKAGDNTARIQRAIDYVASLAPDASGFRGAVLLDQGEFSLSGSIRISASGIVLRGTDKEKTILLKKGVDRGALIYMEGMDDLNVQDTLKVFSHYVPVNARTLEVASGVSLKKGDGLPDISRGLEGRAAGVSVQNVSGTFGTAPKIRVRGATSIFGSSKPLWVVDGVIMEDAIDVGPDDLSSGDAETLISSAIAGLNSDDIESFQILKDGSATSIYGARAMAGVIVVTTKKGKAGVSKMSYTGEFTTRMIPSYKEFNIMNSQEQMGIYKEMEQKGWLNNSDTYRAKDSGVYGRMYQLINQYNPVTGQFGLANTPEARNAYLREAEMRNTDWFNTLFSNNVTQNHSVSITSGTEKSSFYASLSAMSDPGWYKQSEVKRYTANLNTTYNIYKNLSINLISPRY